MAYEKLTYITFSTKGQDLLKSMDRKGDIVSRFKWNIDCKCNQIEKKIQSATIQGNMVKNKERVYTDNAARGTSQILCLTIISEE